MSSALRSRTRMAVAVLLGATLGACREIPPPLLGVSTSTRFNDAVRLAIADADAEAPLPPFDTLIVGESTNASIRAIGSAERFATTEGITAVVGHSNSAASLAASQVYNRKGIVQVAATSSAPVYSRAGPWSFRLVPPDDAQGRFLVDRLSEIVPADGRVAVMYVNDDYGRGLLGKVAEAAAEAPFSVALRYPHTEEEGRRPDRVAAAVEAVRRSRPHAILWLGRATTLDAYLEPLQKALPEVPILGSDGVASAPQFGNEDGRWDVVSFVDFVDFDSTPELRDFARRYRERFGRTAIGGDALHYDAMRLLLAALREGAVTADEVRTFLVSLGHERPPWEGLTGPVSFDPEGDVQRELVLRSVRDLG